MGAPTVSVLVPTYNRSSYLRETLTSILGQSFEDFEVIIVDNCSPDDTQAVVASFSDNRIRYSRNDRNIGAVGNYNKALRLASGKYVHLFSDDDLMSDTDCLKKKVDILDNNPTVGLIHSNIETINAGGQVTAGNWAATLGFWSEVSKQALLSKEKAFHLLFYRWNYITMPTVMLRSAILLDRHIEFNNQLHYLIDWALWLQLAQFCDFYYLNDTTVLYRVHSNNETNKMTTSIMRNELLISKFSLLTDSITNANNNYLTVNIIIESTYNQLGIHRTLPDRVLNKLRKVLKIKLEY